MDNHNWWKENQLGGILTSLRGWEEREQKKRQNLQIHCTIPSLCTGQTPPLATPTHQYILSTGGSAVSLNSTATSAKQTQEGPCQAAACPLPPQQREYAGRDVPSLFPLQPNKRTAPVSHNHTLHYPASWTPELSSCVFHAWLESYLHSYRTHYKVLKKMGTQTYNNLTSGLTEGLAARWGSVHSYGSNIYQGTDLAFICIQVLWSTSARAACSHIPARIWASGAAPASTAGIHPGRANPATSCYCSEKQQTLKRRKNPSLPPPFPKGIRTTLQQLEVEPFNLVQRTLSVSTILSQPDFLQSCFPEPAGSLGRRSTKGLFWVPALCSQVLTAEHTPWRPGSVCGTAPSHTWNEKFHPHPAVMEPFCINWSDTPLLLLHLLKAVLSLRCASRQLASWAAANSWNFTLQSCHSRHVLMETTGEHSFQAQSPPYGQ